jgi:hypothetical protein
MILSPLVDSSIGVAKSDPLFRSGIVLDENISFQKVLFVFSGMVAGGAEGHRSSSLGQA